jgi:hypothetical protein
LAEVGNTDHFHDPVRLGRITIATGNKRLVLFGPDGGKLFLLEIPAQALLGTLNPLSNNTLCQEPDLNSSILKAERNHFVF